MVQQGIRDYFKTARILIPQDLQAQVSQDAAIHSLLLNGLEYGKRYYGKPIPELYYSLKAFGEDNLKLALYLLGLTLGWENTYQYIYQSRELAVLK